MGGDGKKIFGGGGDPACASNFAAATSFEYTISDATTYLGGGEDCACATFTAAPTNYFDYEIGYDFGANMKFALTPKDALILLLMDFEGRASKDDLATFNGAVLERFCELTSRREDIPKSIQDCFDSWPAARRMCGDVIRKRWNVLGFSLLTDRFATDSTALYLLGDLLNYEQLYGNMGAEKLHNMDSNTTLNDTGAEKLHTSGTLNDTSAEKLHDMISSTMKVNRPIVFFLLGFCGTILAMTLVIRHHKYASRPIPSDISSNGGREHNDATTHDHDDDIDDNSSLISGNGGRDDENDDGDDKCSGSLTTSSLNAKAPPWVMPQAASPRCTAPRPAPLVYNEWPLRGTPRLTPDNTEWPLGGTPDYTDWPQPGWPPPTYTVRPKPGLDDLPLPGWPRPDYSMEATHAADLLATMPLPHDFLKGGVNGIHHMTPAPAYLPTMHPASLCPTMNMQGPHLSAPTLSALAPSPARLPTMHGPRHMNGLHHMTQLPSLAQDYIDALPPQGGST
mmetsp:Transcript_18266/g.28520  ORF Transcript_18266/g.28520 Transcript_18266/m.28520 type:complete len:508 (-) Transcript_18266:137-1660(-)